MLGHRETIELVEPVPAARRLPALSAAARRRIVVGVPPLLVALVALPFILHQNAWWEWQNAYWLLQRETAHVAAHGTPTFFLHTSEGVFYPHYVFYAGPMLSLLAYPAALVGPWPVFVACIVGAMVMGYFGIWWTARNLGLSRELSILPALAFATTPYLITDVYGHSAWAELLAVNAVPLLLGALTRLLWHPERSRRGPLVALTAAGFAIAGTHNLTLMISAALLPLILLALLPMAPARRVRELTRQLGRAVLAVALGVALTGAWLVPNLWLGPHTAIARLFVSQSMNSRAAKLLEFTNFLSPWPRAHNPPSPAHWYFVQPPVLALVCALVGAGLVLWRGGRAAAASMGALAALGTALVLLIMDPQWWRHFPRLIQAIQVPARLVPYLAIVIALAISVALITIGRRRWRRPLVVALGVAVTAQLAIAGFIALDSKPAAALSVDLVQHGEMGVHDEPVSFTGPVPLFTPFQFRVVDKPLGPPTTGGPVGASLDDPTTSDSAQIEDVGRVGQIRPAYVVWSPLIRMDGDARIVGRTGSGLVAVRVDRTDAAGRWRATIRPACSGLCLSGDAPWQETAGRMLSLLAGLVLVGTGARWLRRRR
jgi:hypothetical protein